MELSVKCAIVMQTDRWQQRSGVVLSFRFFRSPDLVQISTWNLLRIDGKMGLLFPGTLVAEP